MKTEIIKCAYCGTKSEKPLKELTRQRKTGRTDFFCDSSCSGLLKSNLPHRLAISTANMVRLNKSGNKNQQHKAHLASEGWKYTKLRKRLLALDLRFKFEYPMKKGAKVYLFDLALLDQKLLIEFDGPDHTRDHSIIRVDSIKAKLAESKGWEVMHIEVPTNSVISPKVCRHFS